MFLFGLLVGWLGECGGGGGGGGVVKCGGSSCSGVGRG